MEETREPHRNSITAFSEFFEQNREKFLSFAYSYIKNRPDAEDLLMESMAALWENRDKWRESSSLHGLLLTIIKNKALNLLAHEQVRLRAEENINSHGQRELELRISTLKACDPESIFNTEIQQIVNKALNRLPVQSRRIFVLSRYHNASNRKIAEQLGISVKSVEFHITKALKKLRLELKDYLFFLLL
ncbi:MAG: RNA polymerase sigma-70 factor [Mediterranea sp.]|jgi:RNA polymerase sigma-70 factor (ECF subfamily)|nr:RNA polymerase sigma-70 factor [Mediterranea sp.]